MISKNKEKGIYDKLYRQLCNIPWYIRVLLRFKKPTFGYDPGFGDEAAVMVKTKKLFGRIYVIEEKITHEDFYK